ncbi:MAG: GNAT family N-acetyltransferase [Flavobacteriales bacterium]|nr:GNAT family N-acetyltransferase [Flavobacteriales bacterium]
MIIREAGIDDMQGVLLLIQALADYEKASDEVENTVEKLQEDGFGKNKLFECIVAEDATEIVGMALYYPRYSTWKGKTIYLEDLIVKEESRRNGVGGKLFEALAKECKLQGVKRMEWQVLDWNESAIEFYKKYNAGFDSEWINCRLTKEQLV